MPYFIIPLTFSIILSTQEICMRIFYEQVCKMIEKVSLMMEKYIVILSEYLYTKTRSKRNV